MLVAVEAVHALNEQGSSLRESKNNCVYSAVLQYEQLDILHNYTREI